MRPDHLRILVAGMVAGVPHHGGATWAVLQWVLGLRQLGHDVVLVEPVDRPSPETTAYFHAVVKRFGLEGRAALVAGDRQSTGMPFLDLVRAAARTDLVVNVAGMLRHPELVEPSPLRLYLDLDPAFTQLWESDGIDMGVAGHTHFVTVGLNVGRPDCPVPTGGREWIPTLPPVVLDHWPVGDHVGHPAFTTVASWRGYGSVEQGGIRHGQKAHSWRGLADLPRRTAAPLLPALAIHPEEEKDVALLEEHGWRWLDPANVTSTPDTYRQFIRDSLGELAVAKEGYVVSRSGWFSDRSACYLAAGRPVVAQETGWSSHVPAGEGLLAFSSVAEAACALAAVTAEPERHRRAARRLAEERFASDVVLGSLLEEVV